MGRAGGGAWERSRSFLEVGEDTRDVSGSLGTIDHPTLEARGPAWLLVRAGILRSYRTGSKLLSCCSARNYARGGQAARHMACGQSVPASPAPRPSNLSFSSHPPYLVRPR